MGAETYEQAVARAGVIELGAVSPPRGLPDHLAGGRFEDNNPPTAPRPTPSPHPAPSTQPAPRMAWSESDRIAANAEFVRWVLAQHEVRIQDGGIPMCRCGFPARTCEVRQQAHTILGFPSPWSRPGPGFVGA